jgi:hypothetical protein
MGMLFVRREAIIDTKISSRYSHFAVRQRVSGDCGFYPV